MNTDPIRIEGGEIIPAPCPQDDWGWAFQPTGWVAYCLVRNEVVAALRAERERADAAEAEVARLRATNAAVTFGYPRVREETT